MVQYLFQNIKNYTICQVAIIRLIYIMYVRSEQLYKDFFSQKNTFLAKQYPQMFNQLIETGNLTIQHSLTLVYMHALQIYMRASQGVILGPVLSLHIYIQMFISDFVLFGQVRIVSRWQLCDYLQFIDSQDQYLVVGIKPACKDERYIHTPLVGRSSHQFSFVHCLFLNSERFLPSLNCNIKIHKWCCLFLLYVYCSVCEI
eukprot:TRINITY_DN6160_c0_g1_i2.p1 TRINITY_DN6160_c0_g1~~TRINITY_DN6160_c0_g1_i2.p1  ORF type:complete len:201 (+),score=-9.63 TRINITY_DN6160_c0_g1_i2:282-884(+)